MFRSHAPCRALVIPPAIRTRRVRTSTCAGVGGPGITSEDRAYMRRAIELAKTATGKTFPNPLVRICRWNINIYFHLINTKNK